MTSTVTSFAQQANLEIKLRVKCKNSLCGRTYYSITSSKLELIE